MNAETRTAIRAINEEADKWCFALHGNHDEHQCHKKPGHWEKVNKLEDRYPWRHECTCGVWW